MFLQRVEKRPPAVQTTGQSSPNAEEDLFLVIRILWRSRGCGILTNRVGGL